MITTGVPARRVSFRKNERRFYLEGMEGNNQNFFFFGKRMSPK